MLGLKPGRRRRRRRLQAGPADGSPAVLGPWRHRDRLGAAAQDVALEPPGHSVTAPRRARAEQPPPTAGKPLNRKPCSARRGPPPCSDELLAPGREARGGGGKEGGEAGRRQPGSCASATAQRQLCLAAVASMLTAETGSRRAGRKGNPQEACREQPEPVLPAVSRRSVCGTRREPVRRVGVGRSRCVGEKAEESFARCRKRDEDSAGLVTVNVTRGPARAVAAAAAPGVVKVTSCLKEWISAL